MSKAFRVGLVIVSTLLILAIGIILIGNKDFLFSRTYPVTAEFQNVGGLNNGADVRVGGIHAGTVKEIDLPARPDGKVTVVMNMKDSTRSIIRKDSIATIKTEGLLGDKYVEISFGSDKSASVENGDTIRSEAPVDLADVGKDVAAETTAAVASLKDDSDALHHNFLLRGFFKKRGYDDASELKQNAISQVPAGRPTKEFDYDAGQLFGGATGAKLHDQKSLKEAGQFLEDNKYGLAVIATNEVKGDTAKDRTLTQARAKVVRDYLVQNFGVDDTRLKIIGLGKSKQPDEKSKVEILVYNARPEAGTAQNQTPANQAAANH